MSELNEKQLKELRLALEQRRTTLRREVTEVEEGRAQALDSAHDTGKDAGDEAEARRQEEVRSAEQGRDAIELQEIAAALTRMADGHYGICVDCGADIALQRLQVQPSAARCISCQEKLERENTVA